MKHEAITYLTFLLLITKSVLSNQSNVWIAMNRVWSFLTPNYRK